MKTIQVNLYKFEELSKEVQAKVIESNRYINVEFGDWSEFVIEEFARKLHEKGFQDAKIYFTGFYSQGDGACFDAKINIEKFITDKRLLKVVSENSDIHFRIVKKSYGGNYCHERTRYIDFNETGRPNIDNELHEISDQIEKERLALSKQIHAELETEYEYLTSGKAVAETLIANDYTFEEDGTMRNA